MSQGRCFQCPSLVAPGEGGGAQAEKEVGRREIESPMDVSLLHPGMGPARSSLHLAARRLGGLQHIGILLMPRNPETGLPQPQLAGEVHL